MKNHKSGYLARRENASTVSVHRTLRRAKLAAGIKGEITDVARGNTAPATHWRA